MKSSGVDLEKVGGTEAEGLLKLKKSRALAGFIYLFLE
jgi:hypothetical protein